MKYNRTNPQQSHIHFLYLPEIHCVNEKTAYLMGLIHELGLLMKSTAVCTKMRRIRYGNFTLENALVQPLWNSENIIESINQSRTLLTPQKVQHRDTFNTVEDNHMLLGDGDNHLFKKEK